MFVFQLLTKGALSICFTAVITTAAQVLANRERRKEEHTTVAMPQPHYVVIIKTMMLANNFGHPSSLLLFSVNRQEGAGEQEASGSCCKLLSAICNEGNVRFRMFGRSGCPQRVSAEMHQCAGTVTA